MTDIQNRNKTKQEINVHISEEVILTPLVCAKLINEILKGVLYQKNQIPYPFNWLKSVVEKKRSHELNGKEHKEKVNMTAENHFHVVSTAYDTLERIMKELIEEFKHNSNNVKEVVMIFGTTPQFPREIFSIKVPPLTYRHFERNHINQLTIHQQKILRSIFLSQNWMDAIDGKGRCTYTYIFLKKSASNLPRSDSGPFFVSTRPLTFMSNVKHINLTFSYKPSARLNCCANLLVFEDNTNKEETKTEKALEPEELETELMWCQAQTLLKGFQDCFINKVSACEFW